ncbi:MAG TPA: CPBP family glutamic-type intramembrane protease, partial [Alphaproteobacteria bacterium]|nr:CPBP family glutamic-type intramembrane protease [Alphaproteobacteria bacterium]
MKKCPNCGREYPDDAMVCLIDERPLSAQTPPPVLEELSAGTLATPPAPVRRIPLTGRQMEIIEVILVCLIAFGASILASTYVFFGGIIEHKYNSVAWMGQALREGSCIVLLWYLLQRRGMTFKDLGLTWSWKDVGWSIILVFAGLMAFGIIFSLIYHSGLAAFVPKGVGGKLGEFLFGGGVFFSTFLFQCINPFFEELIARAYLMTEVRRITNSVTKAVVISTALQTSYHF